MTNKRLNLTNKQIKDLIDIYNDIKIKKQRIMTNLVNRFNAKYPEVKADYHQLKYLIDKKVISKFICKSLFFNL
jgi:hypothetical protein